LLTKRVMEEEIKNRSGRKELGTEAEVNKPIHKTNQMQVILLNRRSLTRAISGKRLAKRISSIGHGEYGRGKD